MGDTGKSTAISPFVSKNKCSRLVRPERSDTTNSLEYPPPLPPRSCHLKHHRPLERTKAIEHCSISPPEVSRHCKPLCTIDVPVVPPRPKKFINPEDAFNFEIIDVDEQQAEEKKITNSHDSRVSIQEGLLNVAPLATPESECLQDSFRDTFARDGTRTCYEGKPNGILNNFSSQNCDIQTNSANRLNVLNCISRGGQLVATHDEFHTRSDVSSEESLTQCFLTVPDVNTSTSTISPNSVNSVSTPTSDSGVAFSEIGCRDCSGSSTESEFESTKAYKDGRRGRNSERTTDVVHSHKALSRQISHPPDNSTSLFLRCKNVCQNSGRELPQCPPTPTHRPRRFRSNIEQGSPSSAASTAAGLTSVTASSTSTTSPTRKSTRYPNETMQVRSPLHCQRLDDATQPPSESSNSDSDVPPQSLRRRTVRLPSISENSRIQRVEVLPDGDRLPPGN